MLLHYKFLRLATLCIFRCETASGSKGLTLQPVIAQAVLRGHQKCPQKLFRHQQLSKRSQQSKSAIFSPFQYAVAAYTELTEALPESTAAASAGARGSG